LHLFVDARVGDKGPAADAGFTSPRRSSDFSAWRAVMRLAPTASAICRSDGTRSPVFSTPAPICASSQPAMRW
jgi:hypothetical protein